jgi:hypothetical protein
VATYALRLENAEWALILGKRVLDVVVSSLDDAEEISKATKSPEITKLTKKFGEYLSPSDM